MMDWKELQTRLLSDPEVRRHYDDLAPAYRLVTELLEQRKRLGITQKELARRMGTSQSVVSRLESGEFLNVTLRTLNLMARVLDCSLRIDLIPSRGDKTDQERGGIIPVQV